MTREQIAALLSMPVVESYVERYGGRCRECADSLDGICDKSGIPCADTDKKAIRFVLRAVAYGIKHGYIAAPEPVK